MPLCQTGEQHGLGFKKMAYIIMINVLTHDIYLNLFYIHHSFLYESVPFGISPNIRPHREIQCVPYAGFFS